LTLKEKNLKKISGTKARKVKKISSFKEQSIKSCFLLVSDITKKRNDPFSQIEKQIHQQKRLSCTNSTF
jgi:hypothetical protein